MNKKTFRIIAIIIILIILIFLIKNNVHMTKEEPIESHESPKVTSLNVGSDLVEKLYDSLNLKLINNHCEKDKNCLVNEGYNFLYFTDAEEKILSDDEKMYLVINSLYQNNKLKNISQEDKNSYYIDSVDLNNEITSLFGNTDFDSFNYAIKPDQNCGIIEYTYLKDKHEIHTNICITSNEKGLTKIEEAYKKEDNIYIRVKVFKYIESDNIMTVKTIDNEVIDSYEMVESSNDLAKYFDDAKVDTYDFEFKLSEGNYYLQKIIKKDDK